jgi:hypothetical protein
MAKQQINIGIEGNDGTGDSIRESFRKTNENFDEIYGLVGEGGLISFTSFEDTPDVLLPNTVLLVDSAGVNLNSVELASDRALNPNNADTVSFDFSVNGKLIISTEFGRIGDDQTPFLTKPLDARSNSLGNIEISDTAASDFNITHGTNITIEDLVIDKKFADSRYIINSNVLPVRIESEPEDTNSYFLNIDDYVNGNLLLSDHGFDRAVNGTLFSFESRFNDPNGLTSGTVYEIRYVNDDQLSVYDVNSGDKISVTGSIDTSIGDFHQIIDASYNEDLLGNFREDAPVPRKSAVRRQGDKMEGTLFLDDHPGDLSGFGNVSGSDDLQAATKFYVDNTSYSSTENIFVTTSGDDRMKGVAPGKEGTAFDFGFRSINAAAKRAEEIIRASEPEAGPYMQTITNEDGANDALVTSAAIKNPIYSDTRNLILKNLEYILNESLEFLRENFENFIFDEDSWAEDITRIVNAISFDINRGANANILTRSAAERFYATVDGRYKIKSQQSQVFELINFVRDLIDGILHNRLYQRKFDLEFEPPQNLVQLIDKNTSTITSGNPQGSTVPHQLENGDQVKFRRVDSTTDIGMDEIDRQTAYVRVLTDTEFELYTDKELRNKFDISSYSDYTLGLQFGKTFQERIADFNSTKLDQIFDFSYNDDQDAEDSVLNNFDLVIEIIQNGIDAGRGAIFGSNYEIKLDNGATKSHVDQADPQNVDTLPGKVIVGNSSGAKGRIVSLTNSSEEDTFELIPLNSIDFEVGESVSFGNFVKQKQVTICVESGTYEEDYPIKLAANVSLKGDEFRRIIVRPKKRLSQSKWSDTYFFRDLEFDDIPLLPVKHSQIDQVGVVDSDVIEVDNTSWMSIDQPIRFAGQNLIGGSIDEDTTYYITSIGQDQITVSDVVGGSNITFTAETGRMYIIESSVAPFINQSDQLQGYFGRHYLEDPFKEKNVGIVPLNSGNFVKASEIIKLNISFILEEILGDKGLSQTQQTKFKEIIEPVFENIATDFEIGETEFTLESQSNLYLFTESTDWSFISQLLDDARPIIVELLNGNEPTQNYNLRPDMRVGEAESGTVALFGNLLELVLFAFNEDFNPAKINDAAGVDVFMMDDATIVRNVTVQGHGGFMVVLDPEGQILTKSPYIQTGTSFSKSDSEKAFRGGMYIDAFVGNIPTKIVNIVSPFVLDVKSDLGQGLYIRPPELPCPFYVDGIRYQVNAISDYVSGNGEARIYLDSSSNPDQSNIGQGYQGAVNKNIFLQTAGNRSILGNDFTQINDLGYGLVTNNGALSEMVSMFTYYCQAGYYAKNGSEIRSLNGSNGYGNFALVSEGADPNEIPDQITYDQDMTYPVQAITFLQSGENTNLEDQTNLYITDAKYPPQPNSIVVIDHGGSIGTLRYRVSTVEISDELTATGTVYDNTVYRLQFSGTIAGEGGDFFSELQDDVANGTAVEYRSSETHQLTGVRDKFSLVTRPSTSINFDESDEVTYRSISFSGFNNYGTELDTDSVIVVFDLPYDVVEIPVDFERVTGNKGDTAGDTEIAIRTIKPTGNELTDSEITRLTRDVAGRQPGDPGYSGGMILTWAGRSHKIENFEFDPEVINAGDFIEGRNYTILDIGDTDWNAVADTSGVTYENGDTFTAQNSGSGTGAAFDNNAAKITISSSPITDITSGGTGISQPFTEDRVLYAGLPEDTTGEITKSISLCRATGHDFTQIGTGGYNDSNYPNVILGDPVNSLAPFYTNEPTASSAQVWERRKGRVFWVSTDQFGFFRVGRFFNVDQAQGSISFSGEIGITDINQLGFKKGVSIDEFSIDDTMADVSENAVPVEKAIVGYVNKRLGLDSVGNTVSGTLGSGYLPLNGIAAMIGSIDMGNNQIKNLDDPDNDPKTATNKSYVDEIAQNYNKFTDLKDIEINSLEGSQFLVSTGHKRIFVNATDPANWQPGSQFEISSSPVGTPIGEIVDKQNISDGIYNNVDIITYREISGVFSKNDEVSDGNEITEILEGPYNEFANGEITSNSVIEITATRNQSNTDLNLQIKNDSLLNTDIAANAGIQQNKLSMQKADTFVEQDAVTGWNGTSSKTQSDLGLATFSDENFETQDGYVRIKNNGIAFAELPLVNQYELYGRVNTNTGDTESISFSDVIKYGSGLEDNDFDGNNWTTTSVTKLELNGDVSAEPGDIIQQLTSGATGTVQARIIHKSVLYLIDIVGTFDSSNNISNATTLENYEVRPTSVQQVTTGGDALVKIDEDNDVYATTTVTNNTSPNTIVRRDTRGFVAAEGLQLNQNDIITYSGGVVRFRTPGGDTVFSSESSSNANGKTITSVPDSLSVGGDNREDASTFQLNSDSYSENGWISTNWLYTNFIEANNEGDSNSTGIGIGNGTGFSNSADNVIGFVTNGSERMVIDETSVRTLSQVEVENGLIVSGGRLVVPIGDTADRTNTPTAGVIRFNTETDAFEGYHNSEWRNLGADSDASLQVASLGVGTPASGVAGEIRATGDIVSHFSDKRLKKDIEKISHAYERIKLISGVTYSPNELALDKGFRDEKSVGVIAQEIEKVMPEAVKMAPFDALNKGDSVTSKSGKDYKTVQYEKLVPLLIEAIKDLGTMVEELKGRL